MAWANLSLKFSLSYDLASGNEKMLCNKVEKTTSGLQIYRN